MLSLFFAPVNILLFFSDNEAEECFRYAETSINVAAHAAYIKEYAFCKLSMNLNGIFPAICASDSAVLPLVWLFFLEFALF